MRRSAFALTAAPRRAQRHDVSAGFVVDMVSISAASRSARRPSRQGRDGDRRRLDAADGVTKNALGNVRARPRARHSERALRRRSWSGNRPRRCAP